MQTKLNRILVLLLFVQLGLFAATRLYPEDATPNKATPLFSSTLKAEQVSNITVEDDKGKKVELSIVDGSWVVKSAGNYATKKDKVKDLVAKVLGISVRQPAASKSVYHHKLEVAADKFQRKVTLQPRSGKAVTFLLGSSAGLKRVHLRRVDQQETYAVGDLTSWEFGAEARDWIDTQYFKLDRNNVVEISLTNAEGTLSLTKNAMGKWALNDLPEDKELNEAEVDSLLSSIAFLHLAEPVGKQPKSIYGLSAPTAVLKIVTEKGQGETGEKANAKTQAAASTSQPSPREKVRITDTLAIGAESAGSYYVKSSTSEFIVRISASNIGDLVKKKRDAFLQKEASGALSGGK
jgi:hypothetical protein